MDDILTRDFYARDTLTAARDLLGRDIVRVLADGRRRATLMAISALLGPRPSSPRRGRPIST